MMIRPISIAADSSTVVTWLNGGLGKDVDLLQSHLIEGSLALPPIVLFEALSNHATRDKVVYVLQEVPLLPIEEGYWLRASALRAKVLKHGFKAKTADTLIAQCCIDHNVPLITRDADFKHYAKYGKLKLA